MEKSERKRNLKAVKRKRTAEWTTKNFVTKETQENSQTLKPSTSVGQANKANKRAGSKKNVKNTRSTQNKKTNKRASSKKNSKQNKTRKSKSSSKKRKSSKQKKKNESEKKSGEGSTKKKRKKKGEEDSSSSSDSDESSTESIALPGEVCRNCSRGTIDQLFQEVMANDFGFADYVPRRPGTEDDSFHGLI